MTDLELRIRQILSTYRQRYRVVSLPAADDEAVTAILAVLAADPTTENEGFRAYKAGVAAGHAEAAVSVPERRTAVSAGDGKPGTAARRTGRPRAPRTAGR